MFICDFRPGKKQSKKRKKAESSQPIEELFENNFSKIMRNNAGKSVRMLLPIKTKNGLVEKRIIEEENKIPSEDEIVSNNDEEENKENDEEDDNSDMEIDVDTHVS